MSFLPTVCALVQRQPIEVNSVSHEFAKPGNFARGSFSQLTTDTSRAYSLSRQFTMTSRTFQRALQLRAACALLIILLGWAAVPLSLAAHEPDVCEMECCIEEGHCCCVTRHAFVAGQLPEDVPPLLQAQMGAPCPTQCTTPGMASKVDARVAQTPQPHALELTRPIVLLLPDFSWVADAIYCRPSTPRAPPALLQFS